MINISRSGLELDVALKLDNGSTYTAGDWVNQSVTASVNSKQTTGGVTVTSTTYSLDGGSFWQPYVAPFSFSSEGQHTLDVKAVDSADNELTASYVVRVDTIVPVVHLGTNGNETYATSASTAVTVSDNGGGIDLSSLQYVWTQSISTPDGGAAWSGFASGDSLSKTGVDGDWYLHVQAKDIAGNEVQVGSNRFRLDNSAPEAVLGTNGKETYAMSASTVVTVSDNGGGVDPSSLQYVWTQSASTPDGGAAWSGFASGDTLSKSGVDGDWYVHVQAKDVAGNELQVGSPRFRLDNSAPEAVLGTNGNEMYAMSASTAVTVSDNGSGVDPSSLQAVWTQSASTPDGGAAWSGFANGDILSKSGVDGDWYLHIRAVDAAGNAMDAGSNRFRLDNSAPEAAFGTNGNESSANWASTTVTVSDSDSGVDPSSLQYVWTNSASAPAGDEEWTGFASGDDLKKSGVDGEWYLHVRGMDFVGNTLQAVSNRFKLFTLVLPIVNNQAGFYEDSQLLDRINTIQKMTRADGTTIEKVTIYEATLNQALKKLEKDLLTIRVNDMERVVQVQLPAKSLQSAVQSEPNLTIEVELSGSRYQLPMSAIHWEQIAEKLGLALENMKVNVTLEQMNSDSEAGLRQLAADQGLRLASRVIDFKVTVEAGGEIFEIGDFGGTYMTRAIVIDEAEEVSTLIGVRVEPEKNTFRFVPSLPGTRADGKAE
ncbi:hypothetical protein M6D81_31560, partial [Paenibacillus sp. J5C_2022]|nr:hypothetical protein [Paenibacillus sp. J5C2022]